MNYNRIITTVKNTSKYLINNNEDIVCDKYYKTKYSDEDRRTSSKRILKKYPNMIPIILQRDIHSNIPKIDKYKIMVKKCSDVGSLLKYLKNNIKCDPNQAIYIRIEDTHYVPGVNDSMLCLYEDYKNTDGFLYITYYAMETYG